MGCGPSKVVESLPLVTLCKERRESIKAVSDHRYALASAHVSYFRSLKDVGDALARFVDQEVVIGVRLPPDSPVLTLPSDVGKRKRRNHNGNSLSSSSSLSHHASSSLSDPTHHFPDHENPGVGSGSDDESPSFRSHSHLHLSGQSDSESDPSSSGHLDIEESSGGSGVTSPKLRKEEGAEEEEVHSSTGYPYPPYPHSASDYFPPRPPGGSWTPPGVLRNSSYAYYMKKSPSLIPSLIYEEPQRSSVRWGDDSSTPNPYSTYPQDGGASGGFFGFSMHPVSDAYSSNQQPSQPAEPEPPPPPSPNVSAWDFLDPFKSYNQGGYMSYYPQTETSMSSSPDSKEVREREGIPELEEETEQEFLREKKIGKKVRDEEKKHGISVEGTSNVKKGAPWQNRDPVEGTSNVKKAAPRQNRDPVEGTSNVKKAAPWQYRDPAAGRIDSESLSSSMDKKIGSSSDTVLSKGTEDGSVGKKESSFEIDEVSSTQEIESSKLSSQEVESSKHSGLTTVHCSRDLQEVVKEIRDEFVTASGFGREVALMLEVGKVPYRPRNSAFKVIFSRILYFVAPSVLFSHSSSTHYVRSASSTTEMANGYYRDPDSNNRMKPSNLSLTLDKLYVWEQKLYKEVKEEERLRVIYEKMCKRLKKLDLQGADSSKIDAVQTSIKKWQAKIKVCIRAIDVVSIRIHRLRDEELQPQINQLINGWTRMWKSMLKCHQKQFQAIMESKILTLRANPGFQRDSSLTAATVELEMELLKWCSRFNEWVDAQRSYVESLNGWLMRCILQEPEETDDGLAPFSPCRAGAPPIFTVCSDWCQAMERIAENVVADAMHDFAICLHQLWETLDEEHHQRLKAEYLSKDFEKRLRTAMMHKGTLENGLPSGSGVSRRDDLRVDLDLMNKRLQEERLRHKEAVKLVDNAASSSIQAGLVPIFEALTKCSSEAVKAYEQVRTQLVGGGS